MSYEKHNFQNGEVLTATQLNEMDEGIAQAMEGMKRGRWETMLEKVWDSWMVTPTGWDSATGYFECAAADLADMSAGETKSVVKKLSASASDFGGIIPGDTAESYNCSVLTKQDDTHFSVGWYSAGTTLDPTAISFCEEKPLELENVNAKKVRLTLTGGFIAPYSGYSSMPFVSNKNYNQLFMVAYDVAGYTIEADVEVELEVYAANKVRGRASGNAKYCKRNGNSPSIAYYNIDSNLVPGAGVHGGCKMTDDGLKFSKLSSKQNWSTDHLAITTGTYVKVERWVEDE